MKHLIPTLILACVPAFSQHGDCTRAFEGKQEPGQQVAMTLRSGSIEIVGTNSSVVRVTCDLGGQDPSKMKISFAAGRLRVYGGPDRDVQYRIEVPAKSGLLIRATAGDMRVSGIRGDKDIELRAGNLTVEVGNPADYKVAEGSVMAGNLNARVFGAQKDGLFRSFRKNNNAGQYRFRAELMAGDLILK